MIAEYISAFQKHYPQRTVSVKPGRKYNPITNRKEPVFHVIIDGDKGDRPLTPDELVEATAMFNS